MLLLLSTTLHANGADPPSALEAFLGVSGDQADLGAWEHVRRLSHGQPGTGNAVVRGENLATLAALAPVYGGRVRCIYIDPPYNNQERYTHYNDDLDHATWLSDIKARLSRLAEFLREDGSLWISIDDREVHYLKVAADEVFGRKNFVTTIVWQQRTTRENRKVFSNNHEYLLVYAKDARVFRNRRNQLPLTPEIRARYVNPDDDPRGPWQSVSANVQAGHATPGQFFELVAPNGRRHVPPNGRCWVYNKMKMEEAIAKGEVWFGRDGNGVPRLKSYLTGARRGLNPETLWLAHDVGTSLSAKKHLLDLFPDHPVFDTPKPESLVHRIFQIATDPGDLVLDAYLGSGTTAAVAHKTGRRYIGIELGAHAVTHCAERLRQVVKGESGGISEAVDWKGGGGFDFFTFGNTAA
jgi:adenine-specific DNA-methyltransferase